MVTLWLLAACSSTSTKVKESGSGGDGGSGAEATGGSAGSSSGASGLGGVGAAPGVGGAGAGAGGSSGSGAAGSSGASGGAGGSGGSAVGGSGGVGGTAPGGSGGTGDCSDPRASTRCDGDDLYYETSCGELGEHIGFCCGGCGVRYCNPPRLCVDGDLYASDDCVEPTDKLVECSTGTCNRNVCECSFQDANLETAVRTELGVPSGPVTDVETSAMQSLNLNSDDSGLVSSLSGVECLYELRYVSLIGEHQLTDLSPLMALPDLERLTASRVTLAPGADSVLGELTNLRLLVINQTTTTGLPSLAKLSLLEQLDLANNEVSDLSGLAAAPNLVILRLENNNITDLAPLANTTSLQYVYLSGNPITDLSPLINLPPLFQLDVTDTSVDCTDQAAVLTQLRAKHTILDDC